MDSGSQKRNSGFIPSKAILENLPKHLSTITLIQYTVRKPPKHISDIKLFVRVSGTAMPIMPPTQVIAGHARHGLLLSISSDPAFRDACCCVTSNYCKQANFLAFLFSMQLNNFVRIQIHEQNNSDSSQDRP